MLGSANIGVRERKMQIFIMRHGQASYDCESDAMRPLTGQGKLEATLMAGWMMKMDFVPDRVWVSPYKRAQQTCQQVFEKLNYKRASETLNIITPSGVANEVHDFIDGDLAVNPCQKLLIVSHMPLVSFLVGELTHQQQSPIFQTAGVCEIEYDLSSMNGSITRMVAPIDLC